MESVHICFTITMYSKKCVPFISDKGFIIYPKDITIFALKVFLLYWTPTVKHQPGKKAHTLSLNLE